MPKTSTKSPPPTARRSPCPVSCSLEIFGDRWTLLVIRDLILGKSRFKDFLSSPEGIPTNILTERLKRLLEHKVVIRVPDAGGSRHRAYQLTKKGDAMMPVVGAMRDWGLTWEKGTKAAMRPQSSSADARALLSAQSRKRGLKTTEDKSQA